MSNFRKEKGCPSSFELVDVLNGEISGEQGLKIAVHLASCDFCAAELEFYRAYPPYADEVTTPPIPAPLLELAEALIAKETIHISRLEYLLRDAA
ncbi:MAG TPA: hypothetical protein VEV84_06095 [Pyrinomonadaceae bacterium]|jgi:hypothetical protein|nr:hypothetical protein [Pyrinomonadaceae bacterium]